MSINSGGDPEPEMGRYVAVVEDIETRKVIISDDSHRKHCGLRFGR